MTKEYPETRSSFNSDDIAEMLESAGVDPSEENIEKIATFETLEKMYEKMNEAGFAVIEEAISGLKDELLIESYNIDWSKFNERQQKEIRLGLEAGIDVSRYADPVFETAQMQQIRLGLEAGIDVSVYATPDFNYDQMREIRLGLNRGIDVNIYADPDISWVDMQEKRQELQEKALGKPASLLQESKDASRASQVLVDSKDMPNKDVER